jgi:hypothetical protein
MRPWQRAGITDATQADRTEGRPPELARLLPTTEYPLWCRSAPEGGYALAVYLHPQEGPRTPAYLAKHKTLDLAIRSALAALARDPPVIDQDEGVRKRASVGYLPNRFKLPPSNYPFGVIFPAAVLAITGSRI